MAQNQEPEAVKVAKKQEEEVPVEEDAEDAENAQKKIMKRYYRNRHATFIKTILDQKREKQEAEAG